MKSVAAQHQSVLPGLDVTGWLLALLGTLGLPLLVALYYADGLVVGKLLPRTVLYLAYLALAQPSDGLLAVLVLACTASATLGQWTLYRTLAGERPAFLEGRRLVPWITGVPDRVRSRVGERRVLVLSRNFDRFGGAALAVGNVTPLARSLMTIPAGVTRYPVRRFLLFSALGNLAYFLALTLAGRWLATVASDLWPW